jgi:hypothetical protein
MENSVGHLIAAIRDKNWPVVRRAIKMAATGNLSDIPSAKFHTVWIETGHRIREQVLNDRLLLDALRNLLPKYAGSGLELYRGENIDRWKGRACGFAWTTEEKIARMFASGLNAVDSGGVLLSTIAPAEAIIAGPNEHSVYLGENEYVVDWKLLGEIAELEYFPWG